MPPKKAAGVSKKAAPAAHASYRDMIKDAIVNLKERNGSSRQAIKKYVTSNNQINVAFQATFDAQFNKAIKAGVDKGEFTQPKGPSGPVKLAKKEPATKPAAKVTKSTADKTTKALAAKKAAIKKTTAKTTIKPAMKKTGPKKAAVKPKANSGNIRRTTLVCSRSLAQFLNAPPAKAAKAAKKEPTTKK
ncbi:histone H1 [Penicillium waksmanii]|uniref:histone H1 n=1 Tax=Penicillium waksmanii TaxID=69791 RepID=UPI00254744C7|nr:histone H1 [Penicillium waksmanii]KAJ6001178.1 histone H1 [Penicillium waksmanii]